MKFKVRRVISVFLMFVIICTAFPIPNVYASDFASGSGTLQDPYIIRTAEQLNNVRYHLSDFDDNFKLGNDIDLSAYLSPGNPGYNDGQGWEPIGTGIVTGNEHKFWGDFDGSGYKITGLWINRPNSDYIGLFGAVIGTIKNLGVLLDNKGIIGDECVGAIAGLNSHGSIENCYSSGNISGFSALGGLVGSGDIIINSYSTCNVTGTGSGVGGLAGGSDVTQNSFATGNVTAYYGSVGGLVGSSGTYSTSNITNCYSTGDVTTNSGAAGGIVGDFWRGYISNCYSTSKVAILSNDEWRLPGGLAGNDRGIISNSYYDTETSGLTNAAGYETDLYKECSLTTAEMKRSSSYTDWDFSSVWNIAENTTYPFLRWQSNAPTTYKTTVTSGNGGQASGSGYYAKDQLVTITATANNGYNFDGWYENNNKVSNAGTDYIYRASRDRNLEARFSPITYVDCQEGKQTTYPVSSNELTTVPYYINGNGDAITIKMSTLLDGNLIFISPCTAKFSWRNNAKAFKDIPDNCWADEDINFVTSREIFSGYGDYLFGPDDQMTRAMFVNVLANLYGEDKESYTGKSAFADVDTSQWYAWSIAWSAENNIVEGIGNNQFAPNAPVTREEMAVMLRRYCDFSKSSLKNNCESIIFTDDSSISDWAKDAVHYIQQSGIVNGYPDGSYCPQRPSNRAEVSALFRRYVEHILIG